MEIKKPLLYLATIAALSPMIVNADQPSYSYVNAGYARADIDGLSNDPDGFFIEGSVAVAEHWFLHAGYANLESNGFVDVDVDTYNIGAGLKASITNNSSFHLTLDYVNSDADASNDFGSSASVDDDAYAVGFGVRANVSDNFELNADVSYVDFDKSGSGIGYGVGLVWQFADAFGLVLEYEGDDDSNTGFSVAGRYSF